MKNNTTNIIIQARMGSRRFPVKILKPLCNKPLIFHSVKRLFNYKNNSSHIDKIILAISDNSKDDELENYIKKNLPEVICVRGSESKVLERFHKAIELYPSEYIVRITGDCPIINTMAIESMLKKAFQNNADIVNYEPGYEYVDKGVEVIKSEALLKLKINTLTSSDQEHVTPYLYKNSEKFSVKYISSEDYLKRGDIRITVDTPEDLKFLEKTCSRIKKEPSEINLEEFINFIDLNPEYKNINLKSGRKSTLHEKYQILFRCDGNEEIGLGHIVGSLRLADLLSKEGYGIEFLCKDNTASINLIKKAGFSVDILNKNISIDDEIKYIKERNKDICYSYIVTNFCKDDILKYGSAFRTIQDSGMRWIAMDNPIPPYCYKAELVINALPHPDYEGYDPEKGNILDGLEYFILDKEINFYRKKKKLVREKIERIIIAMGGSDEVNSTSLILESLNKANYQGYIDIVLGSANTHIQEIKNFFYNSNLRGEININVKNFPERIHNADLGFSALGLSTYEMMSLGLPVILIPGNELNSLVSQNISNKFMSIFNLGIYNKVNPEEIYNKLLELELNKKDRKEIAKSGTYIGSKINECLELINSKTIKESL